MVGSAVAQTPGGKAAAPSGAQMMKIVSCLPRTGSARAQSGAMVNGIQMALEEVGYQVGGFTLRYEDWDDATAAAGQWDPNQVSAKCRTAV